MKFKIGKSHFSGNVILYFIMIAPYLLPYYFNYLLKTSLLLSILLNYTSMAVMFVFIAKNIRYVSRYLLLVIVICGTTVISTVINRADIISSITESIKVILICATVSVVIANRDLTWDFVLSVKYFTLFFWVIHILGLFIYPNGIPTLTKSHQVGYYLYGNVNATIKYIFPGMCCSSLVDMKEKKITKGTLLFMCGGLYQFFAIYPSATMIAAMFFVAMWFFCYRFIHPRIKQVYFVFIIAVLVMEIMIVILSNLRIVSAITGLFQKSTDFSGRNALWQSSLYYIYKKPVWGYGMQESTVLRSHIGNSSGSHNYYLDIVYQGGIVGGVVFLLFIIIPLVRIRKSNHTTDGAYIVIGYLCGYLLMFLMEPFYGWDYLYMPIMYSAILLSGDQVAVGNNNRKRTLKKALV